MKRERMTFSLCLAAVLMGSLVSFSALMCLVQTYSMPCDTVVVLVTCCLASGLAAGAMGIKKSWLVTLNVFLLYLVVMLWQHTALSEGLSAALYYITNAFNLCFRNIMIIGDRSGSMELLFVALAIPLAWLTVWTICKESYCVFVIMACAPFLLLSLIIVDLAANVWLVLLSAVLMLLILSDTVRIRSANEGGVLLWWLMLPVALLVALLVFLSPPEQYVRSDWAQMLQNVAEEKVNINKWRKGGTKKQIQDQIDLNDTGPRKKDNTEVLEYRAQVPVSYLRGVSYSSYEDGTWENFELGVYESYWLQVDLQTYKEGQYELEIKTNGTHDVLYSTYYLTDVPASGQAVYDMYVSNLDGTNEYTMIFRADEGNPPWDAWDYESLVKTIYLRVPQELKKPLFEILYDAELENASPQEIADYVRSLGTYDLNTPRVPDGEDFVLYFLTDSHRGYCVHFASAATLLLRRAGIPARYVTGYAAGGEAGKWNTVTENDAHAWVEYYEHGVGWVPLDPTPSQWREPGARDPQTGEEPQDTPKEEKPEPDEPEQPKTEEPEEPSEEEKHNDSGENKTAASGEKAKGAGQLWLLAIPAAVLVLLLRRALWVIYRKRHCKKGTPNQRALRLWVWLVRLYKAGRMQIPEKLICLAEKAKFSQHELTEEEIAQLQSAAADQIKKLRKLPVPHKLWHQYILALY